MLFHDLVFELQENLKLLIFDNDMYIQWIISEKLYLGKGDLMYCIEQIFVPNVIVYPYMEFQHMFLHSKTFIW